MNDLRENLLSYTKLRQKPSQKLPEISEVFLMQVGKSPQEMYTVFMVHIISIFSFHLVSLTFTSQFLSPKEIALSGEAGGLEI